MWNANGIDLGKPANDDKRHLANSANNKIKVIFNSQGDKFITLVKGYDNNFVSSWETATGNASPDFITIENDVRDLVFSKDNSQIITIEYNDHFHYKINHRSAFTGASLAEIPPLELSEIKDGRVRGLVKNGEYLVLFPYWDNMYDAGEIQLLKTIEGSNGRTTFNFKNEIYTILTVAALMQAENITLANNQILVYLDTASSNPILISSDGEMFTNGNNKAENKYLLPPSNSNLKMGDEVKLLEGGKFILFNSPDDKAVHIFNSTSGQTLVSLKRDEKTTFIDWQEAPTNKGFFTITNKGRIHSLSMNMSNRQDKPFWIDEISIALTGLEIINDTIIKPVSHETYLIKRREYIEKLQTARNGNAEADFILKILDQ